MYLKYNDYELLYLIDEGSEEAYNVLFRKYEHLIYATVRQFYPYGDKADDLIQEGRMVLYGCIRNYNQNMKASFYTFFYVSFKRKLGKEAECDYYKGFIPFRDNYHSNMSTEFKDSMIISAYKKKYENDRMAMILLDECFLGNLSVRQAAFKYGINYQILYRKKVSIIRSMKKIID